MVTFFTILQSPHNTFSSIYSFAVILVITTMPFISHFWKFIEIKLSHLNKLY